MLEVDCEPLRRHSFSAPAGLLLDGCLARVDSLTRKVDTVLGTVRQARSKSYSVSDLSSKVDRGVELILEEVLVRVICEARNMASKQCHHCHRLLSHPDHKGIGSGINY